MRLDGNIFSRDTSGQNPQAETHIEQTKSPPGPAPSSTEGQGTMASSKSTVTSSASFGASSPPAVHPLPVLYGSETGTAQEVAEYLASKARRRGFDARPVPLDSAPIEDVFESTHAVFIVSTTGDGEVPSNMSVFWRFLLRRGLPPDSLDGMRFAVFGLGDSGYAKYNAAARKLHARLLQLGAKELVPRGLGDDQSPRGMWGDLDPWMVSLWSSLLELKPLPPGTIVDDTPRLEPAAFTITPFSPPPPQPTPLSTAGLLPVRGTLPGTLEIEMSKGIQEFWESVAPPRGRDGQQHPGGAPMPGRLAVNRRLTADDHFQDVRHFEVDVMGVPGGADYRAGDVAWVHPRNDQSVVETFARVMDLRLDQIMGIAPAASPACGQEEGGRYDVTHENLPTAVAGGAGRGAVVPESANVDGAGDKDPSRGQNRDDDALGPVFSSVISEGPSMISRDPAIVVSGEDLLPPDGCRRRWLSPPFFLPLVCSMRSLLGEVLDISGTPRRAFFETLSLFATDEVEREKLVELSSPDGADLLYEYATREKRTYVEVLGDFPSCKVPLKRLLQLIPRLRPRGFSIASSSLETPWRLHLCVAVVAFRTPYKRARTGVCSSWLASLEPGAEVPLSIRPGTFKLPESLDHPLIMVGPGTGVAPMRSVVLERSRRRRRRQESGLGLELGVPEPGVGDGIDLFTGGRQGRGGGGRSSVLPDTLFFGCRYQRKDFLYGEEWEKMSKTGNLALHVAFSRENPNPNGGRVYVQRRLREQSESLARLIVDRGANVLVSGSAKQMPMDVREAFRDAIATHDKVDGVAGAEVILKMMEKKGRYCVEAWS